MELTMDAVQQLFNAIARGDLAGVKATVAARPELARSKNADTLPVLVFARYVGSTAVLKALVDAGPPLNVFEAAQANEAQRLIELIDGDPALVTYSDDGFTALHFAAFYRSPAAVDVLLARGAGTEAVTKNFLANMPLHAAAAGGDREICARLLAHGANVNARQHGGFTPLHTAGFRDDREMAELFLHHGADATARSDEGHTAADSARVQGHLALAALLRAHETAESVE
jgi:ankyrin repeat protein